MTVSFRVGRYLVALLWHSAPYVVLGMFISSFVYAVFVVQLTASFKEELQQVLTAAQQCAPIDPANAADAEPVKGRAPGLSEHASPFGQTEARAERTLEHPPP
ncbi:hypothetical protein ACI2KX_01515 [Ectopseudomonas khazarica]|uniref:hypothetical protein n=1 Tax=Ectopseudomonas khazarica TaxID=2502979 RepID=UPI00384E45D9